MHDHPSLSRREIDELAHAIMTDAAVIDSATYELLDKIRRFDAHRRGPRTAARLLEPWRGVPW